MSGTRPIPPITRASKRIETDLPFMQCSEFRKTELGGTTSRWGFRASLGAQRYRIRVTPWPFGRTVCCRGTTKEGGRHGHGHGWRGLRTDQRRAQRGGRVLARGRWNAVACRDLRNRRRRRRQRAPAVAGLGHAHAGPSPPARDQRRQQRRQRLRRERRDARADQDRAGRGRTSQRHRARGSRVRARDGRRDDPRVPPGRRRPGAARGRNTGAVHARRRAGRIHARWPCARRDRAWRRQDLELRSGHGRHARRRSHHRFSRGHPLRVRDLERGGRSS